VGTSGGEGGNETGQMADATARAGGTTAAQGKSAINLAPPEDDRSSAIVTIRQPSRFGVAEDLSPEEHRRRADAANAMMQDFKRQIAKRR
jgi:hypothetical protein